MMKIKKNAGMAMLEVLIAMLVVGIGVLPLVYLQIQSDRGLIAAYTKVEHNAAALSIMDVIEADANKDGWTFNLVSGECDSGCTNPGDWRQRVADDLLTTVLPNPGSGLVCITQEPLASTPAPAGTVVDKSIRMTLTMWWYSAGRGKAEIAEPLQNAKSKDGAFEASDCDDLSALAALFNIDTVTITRIF